MFALAFAELTAIAEALATSVLVLAAMAAELDAIWADTVPRPPLLMFKLLVLTAFWRAVRNAGSISEIMLLLATISLEII